MQARVAVNADEFSFRVEIPPDFHASSADAKKNRRQKVAALPQRDDAVRQAQVNQVLSQVQANSTLLDKVANVMSHAQRLSHEIRKLEFENGVDTQPARRHIYFKNQSFISLVDGMPIHFRSHTVRTAIESSESVTVVVNLDPNQTEKLVLRGEVDDSDSQVRDSGVAPGKKSSFRFEQLEWWQRIALTAAGELKLPVGMVVGEAIGTCSLKAIPANVRAVLNWKELLEYVMVHIHDVIMELTAQEEAELQAALQQAQDNLLRAEARNEPNFVGPDIPDPMAGDKD